MASKYREAPEVARVAYDLIREYHGHLMEAKIAYLFRDGTWSSKGRPQLGQAVKVSDRDKELHGYDFLLIVSRDAWSELDEARRRALVDHELCHENDLQSRGKWLSQRLLEPTKTKLFAWYLPVPISDWSKLLQEKAS